MQLHTRKDKIDFLNSLASGKTQVKDILPAEYWVTDETQESGLLNICVRQTPGLSSMKLTKEKLSKRNTNHTLFIVKDEEINETR